MHLKKALKIAPALLLLAALGAHYPLALAQEETSEGAQTQTSKTPTKPPKKKHTDKKTTNPVNNDSPFDYQASEEISQDLSVSFPVDI